MRFILVYKRSSGVRSELHLPDTRMLWRRKKKKRKKKSYSLPPQLLIGIYVHLWTQILGLEFKDCGEGSCVFFVTFCSRGGFHEQQTKAGQASGLRLCFACLILLLVFPF